MKLDVILNGEDNPQNSSRKFVANRVIPQRSVFRVQKGEKYGPYKNQLQQELNNNDPNGRMKFCEFFRIYA